MTAGTYLFSVLYYSDTDAYLGSNNIGSLTSTTGSWTGSSKTYGGSGSGAQYILPASCAKIRLRAGGWEGTPTGTGWTDDLRIKRVPSLTLTATKIKFATSPFSAQVNVPSDQVVVEAQGETGGKDTTFSGTISLTSTSSNGKFSLSELSWSDTSVVFMSSGSVIFFYKDSTVGFPQLTTDNWQLATDTQTETIIPVRTMSETASYIVFYPYKVASDGVSVCTCVAVINDSMGLPIKGKTVNLATLRGPAQDTVTGNPGTTNTKGQCTFTIKSGTGGQDTIVALCDSNTVTRGENRYNASGIWVFDQNINDISGSGNNAIIVNEPFYTQSRFGSCLLYDGSNDYAVVPHNPNLNPGTGSITLEAWVKTSQAPAEFEGDKVIARKDTAAGTRIFWGFNMGGWDAANIGKAAFQMYHAVNGNVAVMSNSAINNNQWHHLVGIRDASAGQIKLYVDGIQQGSPANESLGDMAGSESLTFANDASWFGPASAFQGLIDEVKVYQRVLTEQEIYQSYRSGANFYFTVLPGLKITSQPFTMTRNNPSPAITVEAQDDIGMRDTTFNNTCGLLSSSLTGRFSVDGIYWNTGNTTSINLTAGLGIFYYKDSSAGTPGITAYRLSLIADTQKETIVAPSTYETNSYIIISSSRVLPDGVSGCSLTIQVNDTYSYPVPGMLVSIYASRGNSTTLTPASAVTNAAGQCTFTVKSVNGGQDTITAVCETKTIRHGIDKLQAAAIWCFDDSSPVVFDISGKQNHGQSFNTDRVAGRYGTGLQIDGVNQDYVRVPDTDSLDIVDSLTISVWLKPLITDGNNKEVIEREWNHWRMWIVNDTLRTYFQIGGSGYLRDAGGSFPVADGTRWYHVVYRYSTQNIDVFIDGQNKGSWPATGNIQVSASPIYIGIYDDLSSDKYKGVFDEMRVYSRALSDGEISAMAGSGSAIIYFLTAPRLKITSAPFTVTRNNPSPDITVEARDECDFRDLNFNSTVTLSAGSSGGRFSPDRTTWSAGNTLVLTLAAGAGSFFYKDANTGTVIITAYRVSLIADTQAETIKTPAMFETHSFVILSSARVKADGVAGCSATVVAQDTYGYPVQGVSVTVAAARANSTTITPSGNQVSDTNGQCTWTLKSLWAGMDTITGASGARIIRRGVEKGVTGMWIFEEGAGTFTRDASGNSNTGILKNNPAWASGKYGSCLLYDGTNDYVAVPDASGLNPGTGSITVGAWVKTSQFPPDYEGDKIIVRKDTTGSPRTFWGLIMGGYEPSTKGSAGFQVVKIGTGGTTIFTADPINDGLWHHLAGVRDVTAGKLRLYIDGILKAEGDENLGDVTGSESLCFGNDASFFGTASSFQGLIDEVKLYNFALTVEEIAADRDNKANLFFTATRFMFATPQRTAVTDVASDSIVSEARGNSGGIDVVFNDSVSLSSSSITGRFSVDSGAWQDTSIVYFSAGSVVLYYKDSSPGTYSISVSRAGLLFETQAVIVTLTPVAETVSYLRVNTASIPANGSSACTVSIVIRNVSGQPVTGKTVFISTSRGTANDSVFYPYGQVTDASGICTAVIRSGFAGADTVIASCDGKIITENLVSNCSFENSSVFWDTGSAVVDTTVSRTGSKSLKLRATGSNAYGGYGETLSVTNNSWSVYGISGYIRATVTAGTYSLSVLYYSDTNAYLGSNNIGSLTSTTGSWTRFEKTYGGSGSGAQVLLPQTCSKIRLRACAWEGTPTGTGWTDDLRIKRIPTINFTGTKLKFSTAPFTAQVDVPSDQIVVEAQGETGGTDLTFSSTVSLTSTSLNGKFSLSELSWSDTSVVYLSAGSVVFFYRDSTVGNPQLSTFNFQLSTDTQTETIVPVRTISETASYIIFYPYNITSDGVETCTCVVAVNDSVGLPIKGKTVNLGTARGAQDVITGNPGTTDSGGQCTFTIRSSTGGKDTITASCDGNSVARGINRFQAVAAWCFDSSTIDISGSGNNVSLFGPVFVSGAGAEFGSALLFNGVDDYAEVPDADSLDLTEAITVEAWIYMDAFADTADWHNEIINKTEYNVMRFFARQSSHRLCVAMTYAGTPGVDDANIELFAGQWYHVAFRYDGSTLAIYVNGDTDLAVAHSGALNTNSYPVLIGKIGTTSAFNGKIDDMKIYGRALTFEEIRSSFEKKACIYFLNIPGLRITSSPFLATRGNPSPVITVEMLDLYGQRVLTYNETISLFSGSPAGRFSTDRFTWKDTSVLHLSSGFAYCYYKDPNAGSPVISVTRYTLNGDTQIESVVDQSASVSASYITYIPYQLSADGVSACTAVVTINDTCGFPMSGRSVTLASARGVLDIITGNPGTTNSNGYCTFTVKSSSGGWDTLTARCDGITMTIGVNKQGAVGIWHCDTDAKDVSGNNNNGVPVNGLMWSSGIGGSSIKTGEADGFLAVPSSSSLNPDSGPFTIEAWVKTSQVLVEFEGDKVIIRKDTTGSPRTFWGLHMEGYNGANLGKAGFQVWKEGVGSAMVVSTNVINDGTWHHLAGIRDTSTAQISLYVDGVLQGAPAAEAIGQLTGNESMSFGNDASWYASGSGFNGLIDEIRIYGRVLSTDEIASSYLKRANLYWVAGAGATELRFTTAEFRIRAADTSPYITVIACDSGGNTDVSFNNTVSLTTDSNSGSFSVSSVTWANTTAITFSAGVGSFYYRDLAVGYPVLTVDHWPLTTDTQTETVSIRTLRFANTVPFTITSISTAPVFIKVGDGLDNTAVLYNDTVQLLTTSAKGYFSVSGTTWANTSIIYLSSGAKTIYYRDKIGGNPVITVTRTDSWTWTDTQGETVTKPTVQTSKVQLNMRSNETGSMPMKFWVSDTIEYIIYINNIGTETALNNIIIDTNAFDTNVCNAVDYIYMDTSGYADTWAYTTDLVSWITGNPASGASNIKGLRWRVNTLGINASKAIRFRVRVK